MQKRAVQFRCALDRLESQDGHHIVQEGAGDDAARELEVRTELGSTSVSQLTHATAYVSRAQPTLQLGKRKPSWPSLHGQPLLQDILSWIPMIFAVGQALVSDPKLCKLCTSSQWWFL